MLEGDDVDEDGWRAVVLRPLVIGVDGDDGDMTEGDGGASTASSWLLSIDINDDDTDSAFVDALADDFYQRVLLGGVHSEHFLIGQQKQEVAHRRQGELSKVCLCVS